MSRPRVKRFLNNWPVIKLALESLMFALTKWDVQFFQVENQLNKEAKESILVNADEVSWKEWVRPLLLWAISTVTVTFYMVNKLDMKRIEKVLTDDFDCR